MDDKIAHTKGIDKYLAILGYSIIGIGVIGSMISAASIQPYTFNWAIFIFGVLGACSCGGIIVGLAEIVNRLDRIHTNTQQVKEIKTKIDDVLQYQQGILDAILELKNNEDEQ